MPNRGLLLTITEPRAELEEEFNAWYDDEHLPERLAIPGFIAARRWQADLGPLQGKYLANYELTSPAVLESPEYLAHFGEFATPWTRRMLGKAAVFRRWACEQILPGSALPDPTARALYLACGDAPKEHEQEFNRWYDEEHIPLLAAVPGVLGARRFRASSGTPRYIALYELEHERVPEHPQWQQATRTEWAQRIDALTAGCEWILRVYRAYH
ncbi:MAG: hypothetical protein ACREUO_12790 [Burkholderiales bacterium]